MDSDDIARDGLPSEVEAFAMYCMEAGIMPHARLSNGSCEEQDWDNLIERYDQSVAQGWSPIRMGVVQD